MPTGHSEKTGILAAPSLCRYVWNAEHARKEWPTPGPHIGHSRSAARATSGFERHHGMTAAADKGADSEGEQGVIAALLRRLSPEAVAGDVAAGAAEPGARPAALPLTEEGGATAPLPLPPPLLLKLTLRTGCAPGALTCAAPPPAALAAAAGRSAWRAFHLCICSSASSGFEPVADIHRISCSRSAYATAMSSAGGCTPGAAVEAAPLHELTPASHVCRGARRSATTLRGSVSAGALDAASGGPAASGAFESPGSAASPLAAAAATTADTGARPIMKCRMTIRGPLLVRGVGGSAPRRFAGAGIASSVDAARRRFRGAAAAAPLAGGSARAASAPAGAWLSGEIVSPSAASCTATLAPDARAPRVEIQRSGHTCARMDTSAGAGSPGASAADATGTTFPRAMPRCRRRLSTQLNQPSAAADSSASASPPAAEAVGDPTTPGGGGAALRVADADTTT